MKRNSISVKLWTGIVLMVVLILMFSLLFQTEFLNAFYFNEEIKRLERVGVQLASYISASGYNFSAPYEKAITNVNDLIIVTNDEPRITYINGTSEYKIGYLFGSKYIDIIKRGKTINGKQILNRNLEALIVGVPIKEKLIPLNAEKLEDYDEPNTNKLTRKVVGAIYIITPIEKLESTINAIKLQFLYIFTAAIIVATLLSFFLSRSFSKPLIKINDAAMEIAKGNYNTTISLKSSKEIKTLGETINNLARQLTRVEQIRREFIANVSHEIRTPLSYLQGYTEIMMDGLDETEEDRQKYLKIIMDETVRLRKMVDEILELSQLEEGQYPLKMTHFSMDATIKRVIDKIYPIAVKRNISMKYNNINDDLLLCLGDESRIKQVLINLLNNAIKHSYDYGNIIISAQKEEDKVSVSIRDFGVGIAEEDLPFIWDRFYTVDKNKSGDSTGLGLAIVKNIIKSHGCEITVNSIKDVGTEFCFWLPGYAES